MPSGKRNNTKGPINQVPFPPSDFFAPPQKYSVSLNGHPTSISLEPLFMTTLVHIAQRHSLPLSALITQIDALSIHLPPSLNLSSKLRLYVLWDLSKDNNEPFDEEDPKKSLCDQSVS